MTKPNDQQEQETVTIREALAICGSANHDANKKNFRDLRVALSEAHPAVAGKLLDHLTAALDKNNSGRRGTASGTEHRDWKAALDRAKSEAKADE